MWYTVLGIVLYEHVREKLRMYGNENRKQRVDPTSNFQQHERVAMSNEP